MRAMAILVGLALSCLGFAAQNKEPEPAKFRVLVQGKSKIENGTETKDLQTDSSVDYTFVRKGPDIEVLIDALRVKIKEDGKDTLDGLLSRDRVRTVIKGDVKEDTPVKDMPEQQRKRLAEMFETPICKLKVDEEGKELERMISDSPAAKMWLQQGLLSNARLFHVVFPRKTAMWESANEVSLGGGNFARGKLTYEKLKTQDNPNSVKVRVAGELTNKAIESPRGTSVRNLKCVVKGEQSYDLHQKEWVSGKLTVEMSFDMFAGDTKTGTAKGDLLVTLSPQEKK